jgi:hypothetical protein
LSEQVEKKSLDICKETRNSEVDRYYQTVLLTLGFKDFLDKYAKECRFISTEPRFFVVGSEKEIKPDIVLQYENKHGALCEVKTSFPNEDKYLLKSLKQIEKYSQDVVGWDTTDRKVNDHDILLFCPMIDYDRVNLKIQEWMKTGKLEITKNLCICEWGMLLYPKWGKEIILLRKRSGNTACDELDIFLQNNIRIDTQNLHLNYEKCKFTRKDPPIEYTMTHLWVDVFPSIKSKEKEFETSIEQVLEIAYKFYIPWSKIEGEFSQIRKRWVKDAMDKFCEIGLAESSPDVKGKYKILREKRIKNIQEYIIEQLCKESVIEETKVLPLETEEITGQKSLDFFS